MRVGKATPMKKRITGLFAATLLALSMMAVPAMAATPPPADCDEVVALVDAHTGLVPDDQDYCEYEDE